MKIELYPKFEDVFIDETLKGIFYPLCSLTLDKFPNKVFHFVSSNGLWIDEDYETENNTFSYTLFDLIENKYKFEGDIKLYKGSEKAKNIFESLQMDFIDNGNIYLENKTQTDNYIEKQKQHLGIQSNDDFDIDYYLQTFYEFSINKLNFELNNEFGEFRAIIDNWSKRDENSPIVYNENTDELKGTLNHYDKPKIENIDQFKIIGKIVGCEFFTDGNDTVLFSNSDKILCLNFYS